MEVAIKWIDCADEMPDFGKIVLLAVSRRTRDGLYTGIDIGYRKKDGRKKPLGFEWVQACNRFIRGDVDAWAVLPRHPLVVDGIK